MTNHELRGKKKKNRSQISVVSAHASTHTLADKRAGPRRYGTQETRRQTYNMHIRTLTHTKDTSGVMEETNVFDRVVTARSMALSCSSARAFGTCVLENTRTEILELPLPRQHCVSR